MAANRRNWALIATFSMLTAVTVVSTSPRNARAEEPTLAEEILNALTPNTRGLSGAPSDPVYTPEQANFLDAVKKKPASSMAPEERQKLAVLAKDKPSIDVSINFDFNSDKIGPTAAQAVKEVGKALSNSRITGNTFVIAGHTDGKGSDAYNQDLSERRAEEVKRYLMEQYKIPAPNLLTVGYGKTMLKNASNPFAAENRRVQIVNMSDKAVATKQ
jgi:outer membrane protein OmpA-like peptidoglycan-associated protein